MALTLSSLPENMNVVRRSETLSGGIIVFRSSDPVLGPSQFKFTYSVRKDPLPVVFGTLVVGDPILWTDLVVAKQTPRSSDGRYDEIVATICTDLPANQDICLQYVCSRS